MDKNTIITPEMIEKVYQKLKMETEAAGYYLNPEVEFTKELIRGLLTNQQRYGYWSCPCRLAAGEKKMDMDIICPCDYRDPDLAEFDTCYCSLYVSSAVVRGEKKAKPIPERRPVLAERNKVSPKPAGLIGKLAYPVWRCKVCGYLCGRNEPPEICPICKAKKERFEQFI